MINDHGFSKACPSGNYITEGDTPCDRMPLIEVGTEYRDDISGLSFEVIEIDDNTIVLEPCEDQKIYLTEKELIDKMTKL